ncbi:MAG: lytic transglycosylase domain-containing protein [Deltaproteobacteria bacterium]|jgi:hypothetical protein|nr:lytic transglycosylase domain-containing protein [Deltaproteobacteria bacterium]
MRKPIAFWLLAFLVGLFGALAVFSPVKAKANLIPLTHDCLKDAAKLFQIPPEIVLAILATEGGKVGEVSFNPSGSFDLGPMQINSTWLPILSDRGIRLEHIRDNGCANVAVGAWILRLNFLETKNMTRALAYYHSRDPRKGRAYVVATMLKAKTLDLNQTLAKANGADAAQSRAKVSQAQ